MKEDGGGGDSIAPTSDTDWCVVEEGFSPAREPQLESSLTVANGYLGTRGSLSERSSVTSLATFLAGAFVTNPEAGSVPELVVIPDWTHVQISVEGTALSLETGNWVEHRRILDFRQGILWREGVQRDTAGRLTHLRSLRLASLHDRRLLLQTTVITAESYAGRLEIEARVEAQAQKWLQWTLMPSTTPNDPIVMQTTVGSGMTIALVVASQLNGSHAARPERTVECRNGGLAERWIAEVSMGESLVVTQIASIHASRKTVQLASAARKHLKEAAKQGSTSVIREHAERWRDRWKEADIEVIGDPEAQRALRFAIYHLISAANPEDEWSSVAARALTGETYKGHVFWDTEIYLLPFYTFTNPATARALLMYRYHTLPAARNKARALGYQGALYAWESTDSGEETTPDTTVTPAGELVRILTGDQEHHISADIAYAIWQYWQATEDESFFLEAGAEMLIETARFWASRSEPDADGRYHIRQVIGPDEYHETVDDDAYTNVMAQWNLRRGADVVALLQARWPHEWARVTEGFGLRREEPEIWLRIAASLETGRDVRTGLFEQFHGYFHLEDVSKHRVSATDVWEDRAWLQRSQAVKQADVVAMSALLWDQFPRDIHDVNFRYYEPRTAHGSSLSAAFHALVAARLGHMTEAGEYFKRAAAIDLANDLGNVAGGVHIGALGGLWQAAVLGMAGMRLRDKGLAFDPHVPKGWQRLSFSIQWRRRQLSVIVGQNPVCMELHLAGEVPMEIEITDGPRVMIHPGVRLKSIYESGQWQAWQRVQPHSST